MHRRWLSLILVAFLLAMPGCNIVDRRGTTTTCWVHGTQLEEDVVPIYYGYMADLDAINAWQYTFPNANSHGNGGCLLADWSPTHERVRYCAECRDVETQYWKAKEERRARNADDAYVE